MESARLIFGLFWRIKKEASLEAGLRDVATPGNAFNTQEKIFPGGIFNPLRKIRDMVHDYFTFIFAIDYEQGFCQVRAFPEKDLPED